MSDAFGIESALVITFEGRGTGTLVRQAAELRSRLWGPFGWLHEPCWPFRPAGASAPPSAVPSGRSRSARPADPLRVRRSVRSPAMTARWRSGPGALAGHVVLDLARAAVVRRKRSVAWSSPRSMNSCHSESMSSSAPSRPRGSRTPRPAARGSPPAGLDDLGQGRGHLDEPPVVVEDRPRVAGLLPPAMPRSDAPEAVDVPEVALPARIGERVAGPDHGRRVAAPQPQLQLLRLVQRVGARAHLVEQLGEGLGDEPPEREVLGRERLEARELAGGHGRSTFPGTTNRRPSSAIRRAPSLSNSAYSDRAICPGRASGCRARRRHRRHPYRLHRLRPPFRCLHRIRDERPDGSP